MLTLDELKSECIKKAYRDGYGDGMSAQFIMVLQYIELRRNENATLTEIYDELARGRHGDIEVIQSYPYKPG